MFRIALHNVRLIGYHGLFPSEQVLGNEFIVNLEVQIAIPEAPLHINNTVNYAVLLDILKQNWHQRCDLLEELILKLEKDTYRHFPAIRHFRCSIQKRNPPLGVQAESSEVILEKAYNS
ncbi:MAG TPA: dihydroneopterin aldolase [Chitinophagaceae bacterium]|nr:dihydroneopterin aldolase [Chitinophagaceae bacterium]HNF71119.1 dihydroneopterin aldolase [Chitinophagaceae bacterium]